MCNFWVFVKTSCFCLFVSCVLILLQSTDETAQSLTPAAARVSRCCCSRPAPSSCAAPTSSPCCILTPSVWDLWPGAPFTFIRLHASTHAVFLHSECTLSVLTDLISEHSSQSWDSDVVAAAWMDPFRVKSVSSPHSAMSQHRAVMQRVCVAQRG